MIGRFDSRQLLALILIALGALWLLASIGFVPSRFLTALVTLWPLLAIGLGLDLLLERRAVLGLPYVVVALALLVILTPFMRPGRAFTDLQVDEPIGDASRAEVALELGSAPTTLSTLRGDEALIRADIRDGGVVEFSSERRGDGKAVSIRKRSRRPAPPGVQSRWLIELSPRLPLELEIDGGSGTAELDLSDLVLETFTFDGSSGSTRLALPGGSAESPYRVVLDTGSGSTDVRVASGARLTLEADTGSGSTRFALAQGAEAELILDSGSGSVSIDVPDGSPVRLEARGDGSGSLGVPGFLQRVSGSGDEGVWQTPGFRADGGVSVVVLDAGSGSITVR